MDIRRLGHTKDLLGESPCWDERTQSLYWVDAMAGRLQRLHPASGSLETHELPAPVGSIALCESGAVVVALKDGFARFHPATARLEPLGDIGVDHPQVRLNDGKCDPWGQFVAGTLHLHRAPGEPVQGGIYRLRPDGRIDRIGEDISFANGPCFSADGRTLYLADSVARTIWAYDYAPDAPLENRRVFARTEALGAGPDGAAVDIEGFVWSVLPRRSAMARFAPDGRLVQLLQLPTTYPTSLCFGGPGRQLAYVTSISRSAQLAGEQPQDGGLFEICGLPAAGLAPARFGDAEETVLTAPAAPRR